MKGITTIELTNEKTGEKKTYKDENMITNLYRDLCQDHFPVFTSMIRKDMRDGCNSSSVISRLTKGLVMFGDKLSDDADDYVFPSTNMIGRGIESSYSGQDATLGSFDTGESSVTNNKIKYVWHFNTNQANGTIKSICLCPTQAAKIGFGADSNVEKDSNYIGSFYGYDFSERKGQYLLRADGGSNLNGRDYDKYMYSPRYFDFGNNRCLIPDIPSYANGEMVINELSMPHSVCSIYDNCYVNPATEGKNHHIKMPAELSGLYTTSTRQTSVMQIIDDTVQIVFGYYNGAIPADGTIYCWKVNLKTFESNLEKYKNTSGSEIIVNGNTDYNEENPNYTTDTIKDRIVITKNYFVFVAGKTEDNVRYDYVYTYNRSTNEIKNVLDADGTLLKWKAYSSTGYYGYIGNQSVVVNDINIFKKDKVMAINAKTGVCKYLSCSDIFNVYRIFWHNKIAISAVRNSNGGTYFFPLVLFTKNNLSTPIIKTSEQSMKITYELIKE